MRMARDDRRVDVTAPPSSGKSALPSPELLTLLQQLSAELDAFFNDVGVPRESSKNRERPRRA